MNSETHEMNDEARLTAYALGELDTDERDAIERRLETDETARQTVASVRETAALLGASLGDESAPSLSDEQRRAVMDGPDPADDPPAPLGAGIFVLRARWIGGGLAAAAALALAVVVFVPGVWRPAATDAPVAIDMDGNQEFRQMEVAAAGESDTAAPGPVVRSRQDDRAGGMAGGGTVARGGVVGGSTASKSAGPVPASPPRPVRLPDLLAPPPTPDPAALNGGALGRQRPKAPRRGATGGVLEGRESGARPSDADIITHSTADRSSPPAADPVVQFAAAAAPSEGEIRDMTREEAQRAIAEVAKARVNARRANDVLLEDELKERFDDLIDRIRPVDANRDAFAPIADNPFLSAVEQPVTTFSVDVDTASYANVRRMLNGGSLPPPDAVRIEEMINYFDYEYAEPAGADPVSVQVDVATAPWRPGHRLVRIGLKGRLVHVEERPATNLVFLIDVSGSMNDRDKLPLLKRSMKMLVDRLTPDDRVAIVVYAGSAGLVLPSTYATHRDRPAILDAIERMRAGGSTNGGEGIALAYRTAVDHFIEGGVNRVILGTDGDFNVGISGDGDLVRFIEQQRETGVTLSVLGFGTGNFQDAKMEAITNAGNGNFAYIDGIEEAKKVLVDELAGTLVTIAKDVKIQVHFNPTKVGAYRLIGYENRKLANRDFADDRKDAGDIGAGHTVTALYEIAPPEAGAEIAPTTESRFMRAAEPGDREELLDVLVRYKQPDRVESTELVFPVDDPGAVAWSGMHADFKFAAAVASFGMILRDSEHRGEATLATTRALAEAGLEKAAEAEAEAELARRREFIDLVDRARELRDR